jgi:hypothetical protein
MLRCNLNLLKWILELAIGKVVPPQIMDAKAGLFSFQEWFKQIRNAVNSLIDKFKYSSIVFDFPNIGAVAISTTTTTITGSAIGDNVLVTPSTALEAGLVVYGYVSATDTITLVASNPTAGAINPVSRTYYITVIKA